VHPSDRPNRLPYDPTARTDPIPQLPDAVRVTNAQAAEWWQESGENLTRCLNLAVAYALRIEREKVTKPKRIPKKDQPYYLPWIYEK
jgi:hypothetical protein